MGSSSVAQTNYSNAPISQESALNPANAVGLTGSNFNVGDGVTASSNSGNRTISGSTFNSLDGGAINRAFEFGSDAVKIIADLTKASNQTVQSAASGATMLATQAQNSLDTNKNQDGLTDWTQNKTLIFGGVLVAIAYFYFRK